MANGVRKEEVSPREQFERAVRRIQRRPREPWAPRSIAARKILYKEAKRIIDDNQFDWDGLYRDAFGKTFAAGIGFQDNFRHGKIARKKAVLIFKWMRQFHPRAAARVEREDLDRRLEAILRYQQRALMPALEAANKAGRRASR